MRPTRQTEWRCSVKCRESKEIRKKEKKKQEVINKEQSKMGTEIAQIKASQEKVNNDERQMMAAFNEQTN